MESGCLKEPPYLTFVNPWLCIFFLRIEYTKAFHLYFIFSIERSSELLESVMVHTVPQQLKIDRYKYISDI